METSTLMLVTLAILVVLALVILKSSFFTIHTKQAGLVERLGKFNRIAGPGLNFKLPFVESLVYVEELSMQLMDVPVMSKTMNDATVTNPGARSVLRPRRQSKGSLLRTGRPGKTDQSARGERDPQLHPQDQPRRHLQAGRQHRRAHQRQPVGRHGQVRL
ncbi:MAG: SPFH domain-containing protein, partial [Candidatus Acidiferrales bacterium]